MNVSSLSPSFVLLFPTILQRLIFLALSILLFQGFTIFIGDSFTFTGLATAYVSPFSPPFVVAISKLTFPLSQVCLPIFGAFWLLFKLFGGTDERCGPFNMFRLTKFVSLEFVPPSSLSSLIHRRPSSDASVLTSF